MSPCRTVLLVPLQSWHRCGTQTADSHLQQGRLCARNGRAADGRGHACPVTSQPMDPLLSLGPDLTDNEGSLLANILRNQPVTAYQMVKYYERSPASSLNESKGSVYPIVERLIKRGFLTSEKTAGNKRNPQLLSCTELGRAAVRAWVMTIRPPHVLLHDPLRGKVMSFDLLDREEQLRWVVDMKEQVRQKIAQVEEFHRTRRIQFDPLIRANAIGTLRARMEWLDEILHFVVNE